MNVRLESMCQGDGKIYAQIAIERLSADSIVTLEAHPITKRAISPSISSMVKADRSNRTST